METLKTLETVLIQKDVDNINKIFNLAFELQKRNIATVFVDYSGHVNVIGVRIYSGNWISGASINQVDIISIGHLRLNDSEKIQLTVEYLEHCLDANKVLKLHKNLK